LRLSKRIVALAGAGVAVALLGGALNVGTHVGSALADGPYQAGLGCLPSTTGSVAGLTFTGAVAPGAPNGANLTQTGFGSATTLAGANSIVLTAPVNLACDVALINGTTATLTEDTDPTTVDGGTIAYTLTSTAGRFVLTGQNGALNGSYNCGSSTPPAFGATGATLTAPAAAGPAVFTPGTVTTTGGGGLESCKGAQSVTGAVVVPNQANAVTVGLAPGVPLSAFGSLTAISAINAGGFSLTATYTRYPTLNGPFTASSAPGGVAFPTSANITSLPANCTLVTGTVGAAGSIAGTATCTQPATTTTTPGASTVTLTDLLGFVAPSYYLGLSANPPTIPASPNMNNTTPGVATSGNGSGSTITATHYTIISNAPFVIGASAAGNPVLIAPTGVIVASTGTFLTTGTEPGTDTFTTNNGIFGLPSTNTTSAQQTVAVACGVLPGSNLIFNPQLFAFGTFSFSSCTTDTVTLYGGGAAGQAVVVDTFVGSVTGQQATNSVLVALSPVPNTQILPPGCDEAIIANNVAANTPIATIVGMVTPQSAVVSVWQYNNATQSFAALYFSTPGAPTNGNAASGGQSVFICVRGSASFANGAY
jgi:hypothetical protein